MRKPKVGIVNLGCPKNTVDSEKILGLLEKEGFTPSSLSEASIVLINTCGFIQLAVRESIEEIENFVERKRRGEIEFLGVGGCLLRRDSNLLERFSEIDLIFEPENFEKIVTKLKEKFIKKSPSSIQNYPLIPRISLTPSHYAYLKIAEGCNRNCTFCTIPQIRGRLRSYPIEELVDEAKILADKGAREIILIAQDLTQYGIDIYQKCELPRLVKEIEKLEKIRWIRLLYLHPDGIAEDLLELVKNSQKILPYFEVPVQHISERILKYMKRDGGSRAVKKAIEGLRNAKPDAYIRTEIIIGFPGEREEEFEELLLFLDEMKIERIGVFAFYREKNTVASLYNEQLDEDIIREREEIASLVVESLMEKAQKRLLGKSIDVIVDDCIDGNFIGRSVYDAPLIDLKVFMKGKTTKGEIIHTKIKKLSGLDLVGEMEEL